MQVAISHQVAKDIQLDRLQNGRLWHPESSDRFDEIEVFQGVFAVWKHIEDLQQILLMQSNQVWLLPNSIESFDEEEIGVERYRRRCEP